jgi:hypothetical protein
MQLFFSNEEKYHLKSIHTERDNLSMKDEKLAAEWNSVIKNFCDRNSVDTNDALEVNLEKGFILIKEKNPSDLTPGENEIGKEPGKKQKKSK